MPMNNQHRRPPKALPRAPVYPPKPPVKSPSAKGPRKRRLREQDGMITFKNWGPLTDPVNRLIHLSREVMITAYCRLIGVTPFVTDEQDSANRADLLGLRNEFPFKSDWLSLRIACGEPVPEQDFADCTVSGVLYGIAQRDGRSFAEARHQHFPDYET